MNHRLGLTLLSLAVMVAVLPAQDDAPKDEPEPKKDADKKGAGALRPFKELEKKERPPAQEGKDDPQRVKKLIERLNKNMDTSEDRLGKKDTGDDTRKIQEEIVKDLDELIKQAGKGGGGGGGGGGASSSTGRGGRGGAGGNSGKSEQAEQLFNKQADSKGDGTPDPAEDTTKNGQSKGASGAKDKGSPNEKKQGDQTAKGDPGKDGKGGDGMGGNPNDKKEKNTINDLFKDVWGHLPQNKRQEMDAYAKERFLGKYETILRQYYRTISEQGRRPEGD